MANGNNSNFSGSNFEPKHFHTSSTPGGGLITPVTPSGPCAGVYYADRIDVENIFGIGNVLVWADLENLDDPTTAGTDARVCWALRLGHNIVNDRLKGGPYEIPFLPPYPPEIIDACARLAGVNLYDSRGLEDAGDKAVNQVSAHRNLVERFFQAVLADRKRIPGLVRTKNYPAAVADDVPLITNWPSP
jgi:hypothetical protein